jgi:hypothetical protein
MSTREVVLLQALAGSDFSLVPGQLVECTEAEADNLVGASVARDLLASEPTEVQLATRFSLVVSATPAASSSANGNDSPQSAKVGKKNRK